MEKPKHLAQEPIAQTDLPVSTHVAQALIRRLAELGVEQAFGISGGGIALIYDEIVAGPIELYHLRHENSAAYAATEAHLASGRPTLVFTTTGPGLFNVLTGMKAARWDGAKIVLLSGATGSPQKGRWATQETTSYTTPIDGLYAAGALFDFAVRLEDPAELPEILRRLAVGLLRPDSFIAHVGVPMNLLGKHVDLPPFRRPLVRRAQPAMPEEIDECVELLKEGFAIWVGHGARHAASKVRALVERTGAPVFCSPRGKGIVPEDHPQFIGVTGLGGHDEVLEWMLQHRPPRILVLGSRLSEATSLWDPDLAPPRGFIHVDLDRDVPGAAYPLTETFGVQAEIGRFLDDLLDESTIGRLPRAERFVATPRRAILEDEPAPDEPIRPRILLQAIQDRVVDAVEAPLLCESGDPMLWCVHALRFREPGRFRINPQFSSRGHFAAGVVGAALARRGKAFAVVGDEAMLTASEVSSAVQYGAQAVWIVVNDQGFGSQKNYHRAMGLSIEHLSFPGVDFVQMARSMGADGATATRKNELYEAIDQAAACAGPFVIDVRITNEDA